MGPKGAHYAPTMRPSCPETVLELNRWAHSAPTMRPVGPPFVLKAFRSGTDGSKGRPLCAHAHYISQTISESNPWAQMAPDMRPLCAQYAPAMSITRSAVETMGP